MEQLSLFNLRNLDEVNMGYTLANARKKAALEFTKVIEEQRIPFGIAFLGECQFGLGIAIIKFSGQYSKVSGNDKQILLHWKQLLEGS